MSRSARAVSLYRQGRKHDMARNKEDCSAASQLHYLDLAIKFPFSQNNALEGRRDEKTANLQQSCPMRTVELCQGNLQNLPAKNKTKTSISFSGLLSVLSCLCLHYISGNIYKLVMPPGYAGKGELRWSTTTASSHALLMLACDISSGWQGRGGPLLRTMTGHNSRNSIR